MSASGTLDLANYTTVWDDNFTSNPTIDSSLFPVQWGDGNEFAASNGGLTMTGDGTAAGFMQADTSAASGDGYGLYSVTFSADNTARGAYICMWPGTNVWPGPEIDFYETQNGQAYFTVHWEGAGDSNGYQSTDFPASVDITQKTTVAVDWEANGLTFYVNGQEVTHFASGGSVPVSSDYANGGQNESFGVGLEGGYSGSSITVYDMSYSAANGSASASAATSSSATALPVDYVTASADPFFATTANQTVASSVSNQTIVLMGQGDELVLGASNDSVLADGSGMNFLDEGQGTNYLYDYVGNNTFSPDPAGGTIVTWDNVLSDGDQFDLRYALNASGWDGKAADLGNYLTDIHGSWGMALYVHPSGGAATTAVLDIMGQNANVDLSTFLQHAVV